MTDDAIDYDTSERRHLRRMAWLRQATAKLRGYFWLPCPVCGEHFAGFEWEDDASIPDPEYPVGSGRGQGICPPCNHEGRSRSDEIIPEMLRWAEE